VSWLELVIETPAVTGVKWDPPEGTEPIPSRVSEPEKSHQIRQDVSHLDNSVSEIRLTLKVLGQRTRHSSSEPGILLSLDCTRGCLTPHTFSTCTETVFEEPV